MNSLVTRGFQLLFGRYLNQKSKKGFQVGENVAFTAGRMLQVGAPGLVRRLLPQPQQVRLVRSSGLIQANVSRVHSADIEADKRDESVTEFLQSVKSPVRPAYLRRK